MKKFLVVGFALLASALNAAWKYDPDAKTLTDGVLIFNATLANDNELSIDATDGRFVGDSVPDAFSIDFRTISDAAMCGKETIDGTDYPVPLDKRIVAFVYFTNSSTRGNGCWVLRMSKNGFAIKVR